MPLILSSAEGSYLWPVAVEIPADGGKQDKLTFDAKFRRLPQDRTEELLILAVKNSRAIQMGQEMDPNGTDRGIAAEVLVGWSKILDDAKEEVPFSESAKDQLLKFPGAASAIVMAWNESISGKKAGN